MYNRAYAFGVKLALMDQGMEKRIPYPGVPRTTNLMGGHQNASYDQLLAFLQQGKVDDALRPFDAKENQVDSPAEMGMNVSEGGMP